MKKHVWLILLGIFGLHNVTYAVKKTISPIDRTKSYECDFCERSYTLAADCRYHEGTHTNEGDFICDTNGCDKRFMVKKFLMDHKIKVHKIGLLICNICTKGFGRSNGLSHHQDQHFEETRFFCEECHLFLKTNKALLKHKNHTDHSKIFDRRSVTEPSTDTLTQSHQPELGLSDTDLKALTALIMNNQDSNQFLIDFNPNFMEANTRQTNPNETITTNNFGQQQIEQPQIELSKDCTIMTRSKFTGLTKTLANQKK